MQKKPTARPVIHQTDLFHPHQDPDDHWDLACQFALAQQGQIDLQGVLIDNPYYVCGWNGLLETQRSPDNNAVSQLSFLTGVNPKVVVGTSIPLESVGDQQLTTPSYEQNGVNFLVDSLHTSKSKVDIHIVGSCRDIAIAGNREPDLFREKCSGIYLNAGVGSQGNPEDTDLEFNVVLNAKGYAATFNIPCPIYWMPCFENLEHNDQVRKVEEYGTHWNFKHKEILRDLPECLQNYFNYMYTQSCDSNWLRYLLQKPDVFVLEKMDEVYRSIWCFAGFLHSAGLGVTSSGEIVDLDNTDKSLVHEFVPVRVRCFENGVTQWVGDSSSEDRFIYRVKDVSAYREAMLKAMKTLLIQSYSRVHIA